MKKILNICAMSLSLILISCSAPIEKPELLRIQNVKNLRIINIEDDLKAKGFKIGAPVFMRIHKQNAQMELWVKKGDKFALYKTYPICKFSGNLGPKLKEGDRQAPEGLYWVKKEQLNPQSDYHLAFDLGYPNSYDKSLGRTGSYLMVHGNCVSIGCYAMTDIAIEEIYIIAEAALNKGQGAFAVLALPFEMSQENLNQNSQNQWHDFWLELQKINAYFEKYAIVPKVSAKDGHYKIVE